MEIDKKFFKEYITNEMGHVNVSTITIIERDQMSDDILITYSFLSNDHYYYRTILKSKYLKYYRKYKLEEFLNYI
jgi:hypothetical protein